jgi:hypothetical protein
MTDKLSAAIEALEEDLVRQETEVADTKRMINSLRRRMGLEPLYADETAQSSTLRPDQFYGKPLATAAREYLERRKQACLVDEVLQGLKKGGFDFKGTGWKEKDYLRMLAISMAKNNLLFHKLPNGTFGLLNWYDSATIRKADKAKQEAASEEEESS